jgi:hypothetical protein
MEWNGIFSNRYNIYTMLDCDKLCNDILIKMTNNIIRRTEIERNSKDRLTESIIKKNKQLADDYEKLSDELQLCLADCERRKRDSELAGSDVPPIDEELRKELKEYDSDGGNKRRRRRRRRSFRNKTKRTQRRGRQKQRNQKRNTRRGRSRRHITPHNHMK